MKKIMFAHEEVAYIKRMIAPCTESGLKKAILEKLADAESTEKKHPSQNLEEISAIVT